MNRKTGPQACTQSIKGDARLTALLDPFSFLEHLFNVEDLLAEEIPQSPDEEASDEGQ